MKIQYSPDADVLMLVLKDDPPVNAIAEPGGIIVSYGQLGHPVTVEFLNASQRDELRLLGFMLQPNLHRELLSVDRIPSLTDEDLILNAESLFLELRAGHCHIFDPAEGYKARKRAGAAPIDFQ